MQVGELYRRVGARLPEDVSQKPDRVVREVLEALAERLEPDAAAELGAELPEELGDVLAGATGGDRAVSRELDRDDFIEEVASRLDLDDQAAEAAVGVVLQTVREALEPLVAIEQMLSALPHEIAQMMR
jgi:uncharacterized protein (DUF2267 family)